MKRGGPLAGVRVLELTKVWAGPYAGKLLAFLGAEVIKVESLSNPDEMRVYGGVDINAAPYFQSINAEVLSVQLDMKSAEGLGWLRRMVALSDVVIDNLRPGAMERSGLTYAHLRDIRPDIIQLALKMYGADGPFATQTGYAPSFAALGGLHTQVGYVGETPGGMNIRYGDSTVGAAAAFAVVAALHHRDRTGEGQFIDLSAVETLSSMVGDSLLAFALTGDVPTADGNAHAEMAPHGCYPCAHGQWLSIAVADDTEWAALIHVLGGPAPDMRWAGPERLDAAMATYTRGHDADRLAAALLAAGVPAWRSRSSLDLVSDPFFWGSDAFRMVTDGLGRTRPIIGPGWRMTPDDTRIERGAPLLGEHNAYVYGELLGLSEADIADLQARGIVR